MYNYKKKYKSSLFIVLFVFAFSIIFSFIVIEKYFLESEFKKQIVKSSLSDIQIHEKFLQRILIDTKNSLEYLKKLDLFKEAVEKNSFETLENIFFTLSQSNRYFMQLRYLDKNGLEKIRVDRKFEQNKPILIPKGKLQDKSKRDYFLKVKEIKSFFLTKLDLNMENGKLELPYIPTIRVVQPILKDEEFMGALVVNLSIKFILDSQIFEPILAYIKDEKVIYLQDKISDELKNGMELKIDEISNEKYYLSDDFVAYKIEGVLKDNLVVFFRFNDIYLKKLKDDELNARLSIFFVVTILTLLLILYMFFMINGIFDKHTKLEKLNEKLKFTNRELKNANTLIANDIDPHLILSQSKNSMILTSALEDDTKIIYVNDAFCKLYGYTKDEVIGKNPRFLNCEDREQKGLNPLREAIKNKEAITTIIRNYTKDMKLKYIELSISPIFDKDSKNIKYFLGIHKDVSKEQKLLNDIKKLF